MRVLIGIIAFIVWTMISIQWYVCRVKGLCNDKIQLSEAPVTGNLVFYASDGNPLVNDQTYLLKDSILAKLHALPNSKLQIIGKYYSEETNAGNNKDLGLVRAKKVYSLLFNNLDSTTVDFVSKKFEPDNLNNQKLFRAVEFELINNATTEDFRFQNLTILFPFAESMTVFTDNQKDKLRNLADNIGTSNMVIIVEGHADDVGNDANNYNLGLARARWVKNILLSYKVNEKKVEIVSKGENKPVASNLTETGRSKNRRVEIFIKPLN